MPPPRRGGALSGHRRPSSVRPSVCLSDVAYIDSNSKTKRPRKTKLCTGVPQVTCDSHTDFRVKGSKVKVSRGGGILWRPPSRTACFCMLRPIYSVLSVQWRSSLWKLKSFWYNLLTLVLRTYKRFYLNQGSLYTWITGGSRFVHRVKRQGRQKCTRGCHWTFSVIFTF